MPDPLRVAVIDSGVHRDHPHILADRILPGACIEADGTIREGEEESRDRLGHGTAVAAAILEKAPAADIIPVRVFREGLKASTRALATAVRWSIESHADVINLSLGTLNPDHRALFAALVEEAAQAGAVVVAAREADDAPCWPGQLPGVIGVSLDWDIPRDTCRAAWVDALSIVHASGYPRPIPGVPLQRNLYGSSFAVAQVSGLIAAALGGAHGQGLSCQRVMDALSAQ